MSTEVKIDAENCWLLPISDDGSVAVGTTSLLHLLIEPDVHRVPTTPDWCSRVVAWRDKLLPIADLAVFANRAQPREVRLIAVLGWSAHDGSPRFGGLTLTSAPKRYSIGDGDVCTLSTDWESIAYCAVERDGNVIPVLNLNEIFAAIR